MIELTRSAENDQVEIPSSDLIKNIIRASINNVDPSQLVSGSIVLSNGKLCIGKIPYPSIKKLVVISIGKAGYTMMQAAYTKLAGQISHGVCVAKVLPTELPNWAGIQFIQGGHPIPTEGSLRAGQAIRAALQGLTADDLVLVLVSGGASALVSSPYTPITLEDLQGTNKLLVNCGANIIEVNSVRKHLESLKGGGLLHQALPARVHALILSDVMGDDLSVIASGPTVPDATTFADAWKVIEAYGLEERLPKSVRQHLQSGLQGHQPETLKPGEFSAELVRSEILAGNQTALRSALAEAERHGCTSLAAEEPLKGEARTTCRQFLTEAKTKLATVKRPAVFVAGGETTVTLKGNGLGGRNLEFALAAVRPMRNLPGAVFFTLATDGEDGPTDAAGAVVTSDTYQKAQALGLDPETFLQNNDAYHFFEKVGGLIKTGSTGTNVNDLAVLIVT